MKSSSKKTAAPKLPNYVLVVEDDAILSLNLQGALEDAGVEARVTSVIDDKKRGLVAQVTANGASDDAISGVLSSFTRPWEAA